MCWRVFHGAEGSSGGGQEHIRWCQHPVPFNHVYFATQVWLLREAVLVGRGAHTGHSWGHELVLDLALLA